MAYAPARHELVLTGRRERHRAALHRLLQPARHLGRHLALATDALLLLLADLRLALVLFILVLVVRYNNHIANLITLRRTRFRVVVRRVELIDFVGKFLA